MFTCEVLVRTSEHELEHTCSKEHLKPTENACDLHITKKQPPPSTAPPSSISQKQSPLVKPSTICFKWKQNSDQEMSKKPRAQQSKMVPHVLDCFNTCSSADSAQRTPAYWRMVLRRARATCANSDTAPTAPVADAAAGRRHRT